MEESTILNVLYKLKWLIIRNRTFEMKRLIKQELNNLKGVTEKTCKLIKIRKDYCIVCKNLNCNKKQNSGIQKGGKNNAE